MRIMRHIADGRRRSKVSLPQLRRSIGKVQPVQAAEQLVHMQRLWLCWSVRYKRWER
jgi:hypothetical protein